MAVGIPETKMIKDLKDMTFYIPAYQRGYRWTAQEVGDLLDDIYEFDTGKSADEYCLQPLIVKKKPDNSYEVVDGQQRLTTVFIFLKIAEKKLAENGTDYEPITFKITFETRDQSEVFLSNLSNHDGKIIYDNIDYYHITTAYKKINDWLDSKSTSGDSRVLSTLFKKITNNVIFIWYEIPDTVKPVELFTRVNMGKIRLSNAELIKALLFNNNNFKENAGNKQQELSLKWDRIEHELQRDPFWYFLTDDKKSPYETRIDLLFNLLSDKYNETLPEESKIEVPESYNHRTFLIFYAAYKNAAKKGEFVDNLWKDVEFTHERFMEWYHDYNKYHIIGFLISAGTEIKKIFELSDGKKKSEICSALVKETEKYVKHNWKEPGTHDRLDLDKLSGMSYDASKKELRHFFLLVNIATLVCKNEKQYRFPFDLFKREKWDIEHIHATADKSEEADDSIGNLTLLSAEINRSYKNAPFSEKRKIILERDRKGMFIPVCTKNVFTKQYSDTVLNMEKWEQDDKINYVKAMGSVLEDFWKEKFEK